MITVHYPNRMTITYNDANRLQYTSSGDSELRQEKDGKVIWIATVQASSGAIIEAVAPCKVTRPYDPALSELDHVRRELRDAAKEIRLLKKALLKRIKEMPL